MNTGSGGTYNAICYEMDLDNNQGHRGNSGNINTDFTQANAVGLSVTGNSVFSSTSGILVSSQNQTGSGAAQWNRGITQVGSFGVCGYQDVVTAPVGVQFDGQYALAAINMASVYGNAGALTNTALLMKNNQSVAWQTADTTSTISIKPDVTNNMLVGVGAANVISGAPLSPLTSGSALGTGSNFWGAIFSNVGVVAPSDMTLKRDVNPLSQLNPMSMTIAAVAPIRYRYLEGDDYHYGFDAAEIKSAFELNFAGYKEIDGVGHIVKDELIAVLWQALRDVHDRLDYLEAQVATMAAPVAAPPPVPAPIVNNPLFARRGHGKRD
jgi:hypothetical protein